MRSLNPFLVSFTLTFGGLFLGGKAFAQEAASATENSLGSSLVSPSAAPAKSYTLDAETLRADLSEKLVERFKIEGELELVCKTPWRDLPASAMPYVLRVSEFPSQMSGNITVRLTAQSGSTRTDLVLSFSAMAWRDAYVTRGTCEAGQALDISDLDLRRVDMLNSSSRDCVPAGTLGEDLVYKLRVQPGRLLTIRDFIRHALVKKGQEVDVSAVDGSLCVSMKGIALQNGCAGDTITVRNPNSKRDIHAEVVGEGRVQVKF